MADENQIENGGINVTLAEIDPRFAKQFTAAQSSIEKGSPDYAVGVCNSILAKHPACAEVRRLLHIAYKKISGKPNILSSISASISGIVYAGKVKPLEKKEDIAAILAEGENLLKTNPYNVSVLGTMAKECEKFDYWTTAVVCYQDIAEAKPKDMKNLLSLGNAFIKALLPDDAMRVGEAILRVDASNGEAQNMMRVASVIKTMLKDKWEKEGDFKEKIKSSEETLQREQENRLANDEDTLNHMVEREKKQIEEDPQNINIYRDLAHHLRALKRFGEALEYVRKARQQPLGQADTTLEKLEQDLVLADMDSRLSEIKAKLDANPNDAELAKKYDELKAEEHSFRLTNAKRMVERYPNDFNYRFILGQLLLEDGMLDEAIAQFQLSQRNPKVRLQSLLGLGRAFIGGKKYDLAVDQLETAKRESLIMNDSKKEIIYELARAYELMNSPEKAFIEYKEIYSSDIGYKDVAAKINAYYESKNK